MTNIEITPITTPFSKTLVLPGSKSLTNRALIMAFLCHKPSKLTNLLDSDDAETCQLALKAMREPHDDMIHIDCRDAGTVARFLLPVCAAHGGIYSFDGSARMRERPLGELITLLKEQGVTFTFLQHDNKMPFIMTSSGLKGGELHVDITDSSQFLSGLLIAAPLTHQGMKIKASAPVTKKPYVLMTLELLAHFGIRSEIIDDFTIFVPKGEYQAVDLAIEPDASTASYFFAAAALTQSRILIPDLTQKSLQGDMRFLEVLKKLGCTVNDLDHGTEVIGPAKLHTLGHVNMTGFTDTFMTLAAITPFLSTPTTIEGLSHTRLQESDRVHAMAEGLNRLGIKTEETHDLLTIFPGIPKAASIDSYNDHRIAMSFSLIGLKIPGIKIEGSECVSKTCPIFFELLDLLHENN